ncbi:MAG TPA: hypothetical protein PKX17_03470 [Candidatus Methanomethylicus sp.]|nr:hypothetical protein [Candidatus Methanomethylicus sp.]
MISETAFLFFAGVAITFFILGMLSSAANSKRGGVLTFFSTGLFLITAIMASNVGAPDGTTLYESYTTFGPLLAGMGAISIVIGILQSLED